MIQLQYIKENRDECIERLKIKNVADVEQRIDEIISLDEQRRSLQQKSDAVKAEQNAIAKEIGMLFKQGKRDEAEAKKARTAELKSDEKQLADLMSAVEQELNTKLISLPNTPHLSVPKGNSADDNLEVGRSSAPNTTSSTSSWATKSPVPASLSTKARVPACSVPSSTSSSTAQPTPATLKSSRL